MGTRIELSDRLHEIPGVKHWYFQPPENHKMEYPCIVYDLDGDHALHADNGVYRRKRKYTVTFIDYDVESEVPDLIGDLFGVRMDRHFESDGLHHFVYTIHY